jgi:hypothetical protein
MILSVGFPLPTPTQAAQAVGDHGDIAGWIVVGVFWTLMVFLVWLGNRANPSTPPDDGWNGPDDDDWTPPVGPPDPDGGEELYIPDGWLKDLDLAGVR